MSLSEASTCLLLVHEDVAVDVASVLCKLAGLHLLDGSYLGSILLRHVVLVVEVVLLGSLASYSAPWGGLLIRCIGDAERVRSARSAALGSSLNERLLRFEHDPNEILRHAMRRPRG